MVNTTDKIVDFAEFKMALRSFEENEKASAVESPSSNENRVMQANFQKMQVRGSSSGNGQQQHN